MSLEIKFCPNCNNILNITKNPPKSKQTVQVQQNIETPNTISDTETSDSEDEYDEQDDTQDDSTKIEKILEKLAKSEVVTDAELGDFKFEQFMKHKTYQKMDKKTKSTLQAKLASFYEKLEDSTSAYYFCGICSYAKPIEAGTLVASRTSSGSTNMYMNMDKLKNRVHNKMLPFTRNYICTNTKCISHTDHTKREAVMFRVGNSIQSWYTCTACQSNWKGE